ncbi:hypothetical protein [Calothrix sp. CCY 0018]|uniref:hypothetical protein n=1 Tax=Calothrix sp. CCY 0018 TaxID=3103864 RepID=UPI0039C7557E
MSKNGNGHRDVWNPVKVFIRLFQGVWKKRDEVSGETYLVDSEVVRDDLDDIADEPFINLFNAPNLSPSEEFKAFGTSMKKVAVELFRINGGKQGYYIANILDKKYYYCGVEWEDVKLKLRELGIGRPDPM